MATVSVDRVPSLTEPVQKEAMMGRHASLPRPVGRVSSTLPRASLHEEERLPMAMKTSHDSGTFLGDLTGSLVSTILEMIQNFAIAYVLVGDWPSSYIYLLFLHVMFGNILGQAVTSATSGLPATMTVGAFENLSILQGVRASLSTSMADAGPEAQMATFLVLSTLCSFAGAVMLAIASHPQLTLLLDYFPDHLRSGVFGGIGISIFMLGFDSYGLSPYDAATWTCLSNWLKWCPAYILGSLLWLLNEKRPSTFLFLVFSAIVIVVAHIIFAASGLGLSEAVQEGHLLGEVEAQWFFEYHAFLWRNIGKVDGAAVVANLDKVVMAAFVGPVLNVAINVVILNAMFDDMAGYSKEFRSQAWSLLGCGLGCGWNAYISVSNTVVMRNAGGKSARATLIHALQLLALCIAKPVCPLILLLMPTALVAAIFVYLGVAIAKGCLIDSMMMLQRIEKASVIAVAIVSFGVGVLPGVLFALLLCLTIPNYQDVRTGSIDVLQSPTVELCRRFPPSNAGNAE